MKKITKLFVKAALVAVFGLAGAIAAWGDTETFNYSSHKGKGTSGSGSEYTMSGTKVSITNSKFYCGSSNSYAQFYANGTTTITPGSGVTVTGVELTASSTSYNGYQSSGSITASTGSVSGSTSSTTVTWSGSATAAFTISNNKQIRWTSIVVTYSTGGSPSCSAPTFSPAAGAVLSGTTVTLSTSTDGASIYYTMGANPADPTSSSTLYSTPISVTEATTIKAIAIKDGLTNSSVASASYTIATPKANIAALTEGVSAGSYYVTLDDAVVTYVNGNNAYIQDASGAVLLYKASHGLTAGDVLDGTASVTYQLRNSNPQITDISGVTPVSGSAPDPTEVAQSAWSYTFGDVLSKYFKITGATLTYTSSKYYVSLNGDSVQLYKSSGAISGLDTGETYTIVGFPTLYNSTKELVIFADPELEASPDPTILVSTSSLSGFTYEEGSGPSDVKSFTVSGSNLTANISLSMGGSDYEMSLSSGSGYTTSLSIVPEAGVVTNTTIYVRLKADKAVGAYSGSSITVSSTGAEDKTVSLSGTVTAYVAPYATLPFAFDGDKDDIAGTAGLTADGLGNYNTSPKLKFDTTGDYLILRINERPGTLTFDIKNNSFSGGTFSVQTSTDGSSYSVLKNYSSITDTQHETFDDLDADIRYIKWVYTEKSAGNVAIGNIQLTTVAPVVSVANTAINVDASGAEGIINVSYKYFTLDDATTLFYESDGSTSATYDWLSAEINGANNIAYSIDPYHGNTPRTAYFKVFAMDDSSNSYLSELITVTQAAYSAGFAELPFEYDGNGTGALPTGLSTHGLGTYASSPKMKFDDTGDYLVLQFASQASSVSFDIKGNGFSGGTFTVQGSTDGISYNDLKSYTELGDKKSESIDLASSIRYIRWIYTSKSSGNVALGNIAVSAEANPTTITLTASPNGGRFWVSFYNSSSLFTLPAGAEAFTMNSSHQLYRLGTNGSVIPKNTAVIIISDASTVTLTKGSDAAVSINGGGNILLGSNSPILVSGISGTPYVLGIKKGVVGFYQYTDTNIPANKAYYVVE